MFASALGRTNPRFDADRFLTACLADPMEVPIPRPQAPRSRGAAELPVCISTPSSPRDSFAASYIYSLEEIADSQPPPRSRPTPTSPVPAPEYRIQSEGWRYLNRGEPLDRSQDQVDPSHVGMSGSWCPIADDDWVSPGFGEERLFRRPYRPYRIVPEHPHLRFLNVGERLCFATDMWWNAYDRRIDPLNRHVWVDGHPADSESCHNFVRQLYRPVPGHDGWRYLEPGEVPVAEQDYFWMSQENEWVECLGVAGEYYTVRADGTQDRLNSPTSFRRRLTFPLPHSAGATPPQVNTFYGVHPARSTRPIRPLPLP